MVMIHGALEHKNDCAGEVQQQLYKQRRRPLVREGAQHQEFEFKILSWAPDGCFTPRETGHPDFDFLEKGKNTHKDLTGLSNAMQRPNKTLAIGIRSSDFTAALSRARL
jgi:hypothetical protein